MEALVATFLDGLARLRVADYSAIGSRQRLRQLALATTVASAIAGAKVCLRVF